MSTRLIWTIWTPIPKKADKLNLCPFPRYWPFVWEIHQSPMNSPHKGQWCGALMFSLICAWINGLVNNRETVDLRRHRAHYDVTLMTRVTVESTGWLSANWHQYTCLKYDAIRQALCSKRNTCTGLIPGSCPANEIRRYKVMPSLIGWAQT